MKTITLKGNLKEIRQQMNEININDHDITILALQPGIGKTTFMKNFCNNNPDLFGIGIATKRHNFLKEAEKDIEGFCHWYGFAWLCNKIEQTQKFYDLGIGASMICPAVCPKEEMQSCEYRMQFKNLYRAGFPTEYLNTEYIKPFYTLFIEESIYDYVEYVYDDEKFIEGLNAFYNKRSTIHAIQDRNFLYFLENTKYNIPMIDLIKKKQETALRKAIKEDNKTLAKTIKKLNVTALRKCVENHTEHYSEPYIFRVFEIADAKRVILNHATFNEAVFNKLLERWYKERKKEKLDIIVYRSEFTNKDSIVYHYGNKAYSKSLMKYDKIYEIIKKFYDAYGSDLAVITYKNIVSLLKTFTNIEAENFGNTSGLNKFRKKKVLLIVGTPNIGHANKIQLHNNLFRDYLDEEYLINEVKYEASVRHKYPNYFNTELYDISIIDELEIYDTIHRIRPLLANKEIHVFGKLPTFIGRELKVVEISNGEIDKKLKELPKKKTIDYSILEDAVDEKLSNTKFARKYKITMNSRYDTKLAEKIRKILKNIVCK